MAIISGQRLLKPLFELAYQRSTLDNAIEENRFVIIAVNDYVNKKETRRFLSCTGCKAANRAALLFGFFIQAG